MKTPFPFRLQLFIATYLPGPVPGLTEYATQKELPLEEKIYFSYTQSLFLNKTNHPKKTEFMNKRTKIDALYEVQRGDFLISTDQQKLDFKVIHRYLSDRSYWSAGIPIAVVQKAASGSVCFGLYHLDEQIGYTRLITDEATFGYLADVFILESYQGQGLGKWLIDSIMTHPAYQGFRRWVLATRDAHRLYEKFGFTPLSRPEVYMEKVLFREYVSVDNKGVI